MNLISNETRTDPFRCMDLLQITLIRSADLGVPKKKNSGHPQAPSKRQNRSTNFRRHPVRLIFMHAVETRAVGGIHIHDWKKTVGERQRKKI